MAVTASTSKEYDKIDVRLCYPFVQAFIDTLKVQCGLVAKMGKPQFKQSKNTNSTDIVAITGIASDDTLAAVALTFETEIFLEIMGSMIGEKCEELTPDLEDGVSELLNIVFNQAKKTLKEKKYGGFRSIPTIIFSPNMRVRYLTRGRPIVLPVELERGTVYFEFSTQTLSEQDKT